jgi:hypothetical protein
VSDGTAHGGSIWGNRAAGSPLAWVQVTRKGQGLRGSLYSFKTHGILII